MIREPKAKPPEDALIRAKQVAELLGVSASAVYAGKCGVDKLTRIIRGARYVRWSRNEVLALIQQQIEDAKAEQARQKERLVNLANQISPRHTFDRNVAKEIFQRHRNKRR